LGSAFFCAEDPSRGFLLKFFDKKGLIETGNNIPFDRGLVGMKKSDNLSQERMVITRENT
jgi:hypothetical protein